MNISNIIDGRGDRYDPQWKSTAPAKPVAKPDPRGTSIRGRRRNRWRAKAEKRYWQEHWDHFYGYKRAEELMFGHEWEGDDWDDEPYYENEEDDPEYWLHECGQGQGYEGCTKAGSEECEFECPLRDEIFDEAIAQ